MKNNLSIPINVDAEVSVDEIIRCLGREQTIELIKALDLAVGDWGLTLELCDHFDGLREKWKKEQAEDALSCEVCKGTGTVYAFMNGRNGAHPCPRGCDTEEEPR